MRCDDVAGLLPQTADGTVLADPRARQHVEQCLRCQAEVVHYRRLLRALRSLRAEVDDPGPEVLAEILAGLEAGTERHALRALLGGRRAAYLGGLAAAATAAGAAGALVLTNRSRRGRVHLAG